MERAEIHVINARLHGADIEMPSYAAIDMMFEEEQPLENDPLYQRWQQTVNQYKQKKLRIPDTWKGKQK